MKVLIAAIACHPTAGSEAYVGWQAVNILRREHELSVLTSLWCREAIEKAVKAGEGWERVRFVYVDEKRGEKPCHPNRLIARLHSWIDYRRWCKDACEIARQLIKQEQFVLAHHVTYASWRMGSPLAGLGIPWIWGPIGGGERFPWKLAGILSPVAALFEIVRSVDDWISKRASKVKKAATDASLIIASNQETKDLIVELGTPSKKVYILSQAFLGSAKIHSLQAPEKQSPHEIGYLKILAGGNLEGRKGAAITLHGLALAKRIGVPFRYSYLGRGPELVKLVRLTEELGITSHVSFIDSLRGDAYVDKLKSGHIFLQPSLRESAGLTLIEAMAAGCVPVVANCGGPWDIVSAAGVHAISVGSVNEMAKMIAERLAELWKLPLSWSTQSESSAKAIREKYSAEYYGTEINRYYRIAVARAEVI